MRDDLCQMALCYWIMCKSKQRFCIFFNQGNIWLHVFAIPIAPYCKIGDLQFANFEKFCIRWQPFPQFKICAKVTLWQNVVDTKYIVFFLSRVSIQKSHKSIKKESINNMQIVFCFFSLFCVNCMRIRLAVLHTLWHHGQFLLLLKIFHPSKMSCMWFSLRL